MYVLSALCLAYVVMVQCDATPYGIRGSQITTTAIIIHKATLLCVQ